jgi:hypothetical protein
METMESGLYSQVPWNVPENQVLVTLVRVTVSLIAKYWTKLLMESDQSV